MTLKKSSLKASQEFAKTIAQLASDAQPLILRVLDISELSSFTNCFVIASGTSERQVQAIADRVVEGLKKQGVKPTSVEGYSEGRWILIDCFDVMVHVFLEDMRAYYDLEGRWKAAKRLRLNKSLTQKSPLTSHED